MAKAKGGTSANDMGVQVARGTSARINAQIAREGGNMRAASGKGPVGQYEGEPDEPTPSTGHYVGVAHSADPSSRSRPRISGTFG